MELREQFEQALKPIEALHERGKREIWAMDEQEFAQYRREVALAVASQAPDRES